MCVKVSSDGVVSRSRRSGRLRLPPLAFWTNQRLIVPLNPAVSTQLKQGCDDEVACRTPISFTEAPPVIMVLKLFVTC